MGGQTSTQETTSNPPDWAKPLFEQSASQAQKIYDSGAGGNVYTGQTVADIGNTTQSGITGTQNVANSYSDPAYQASLNAPTSASTNLSGMAAGDSVLSNPYFEQALQGQLDKTAAQTQSQFSGAGRYGSAADTGALATSLGNIRSTALSNQYNQDVANQLAANGQIDASNANRLGLINSSNQGALAANQATTAAGQLQDKNAQDKLTAAENTWLAQDNQPWTRLGLLQSAAQGSAGNYGTNIQTVKQPGNPLSTIGAIGSMAMK